jgi:hypothetical protein
MVKLQAMPKAVNITANISNLIANNREYCTDEEKAVILMSTLLPKQWEPVLAEQRTRQKSVGERANLTVSYQARSRTGHLQEQP